MGLFTDGFKLLKKASEPLYKTPKSIQETIEIMAVAENGIFEVSKNKYSKCYRFQDINYTTASGIAYPASKFAVNGLTVSLARELGPKGIRVNAVAPGITETDMMKAVPKEVIEPMIERIPLRRLGQPEDIANAFVFLASDEASYITGVILSVDGMARS